MPKEIADLRPDNAALPLAPPTLDEGIDQPAEPPLDVGPMPWASAVHEAGHLLVAIALGDPYRIVSANIIADVTLARGGCVESEVAHLVVEGEREILSYCMIMLGGWAGEYLVFNAHSRYTGTDSRSVRGALQQLKVEIHHEDALFQLCMSGALTLLKPNEKVLRALAQGLERSGRMSREQIYAFIDNSFVRTELDWGRIRRGQPSAE